MFTSPLLPVAGMDYTTTSEVVMFSSTVMRQCVTVPILDDSVSENPELFTVTLSSDDPDVSSTVPTTNVLITDDDSVTVGIEMETYSSSEGDGVVEVCVVVVTGTLDREISVSLATSPGSAQGILSKLETVVLFIRIILKKQQ